MLMKSPINSIPHLIQILFDKDMITSILQPLIVCSRTFGKCTIVSNDSLEYVALKTCCLFESCLCLPSLACMRETPSLLYVLRNTMT